MATISLATSGCIAAAAACNHKSSSSFSSSTSRSRSRRLIIRAIKEQKNDQVTQKYGLEAALWKVGISANEPGEKVGTFALAHAASPIRFPPTVALTPIVASWIGKKVDKDN